MRLAIRGRTNGRAHQTQGCKGRVGGLRRQTTQARSPGRRLPEFSRTHRFPSASRTRRRFNRPRCDRGATPTKTSHVRLSGMRVGPANGCRQRAKPRPSPTPTARPRTVAPESPCGTTTDPFPTRRTDRSMPIPSPPTPPKEGRDVRTRHRGTKTRWGAHGREPRPSRRREGNVRVGSSQTGGQKKPASVLGTGNQPNRLGSSSENNRLPRTK